MDDYVSIFTYCVCIFISYLLYRFRHLLTMIFVVLFIATWLWAALMTAQTLSGDLSVMQYVKQSIVNATTDFVTPAFMKNNL